MYIIGESFYPPAEMPIGVVNLESNCENFNNSALCVWENISCVRIEAIKAHKILKPVLFDTFDDAFREARTGKFFAILVLRKNFSRVLERRFLEHDEVKIGEDLYAADLYRDNFDLHLSQLAFSFMVESVENSLRTFLADFCHFSPKHAKISPIEVGEPIYGVNNGNYKQDVVPPYLLG